jgi:hypothetical protein
VAPGKTFEVDTYRMLKNDQSVSGMVVDPDGKPVAGAVVSAWIRSGSSSIPRAFTERPTGKDGRFTISHVPNVPLKLDAYIRQPSDSKGGRIRFPANVDAEPGQKDVRILLDPKLVRRK